MQIILYNSRMKLNKGRVCRQQQKQEQHAHSPSSSPPKRIFETIYGSRFIKNSKQLAPLISPNPHATPAAIRSSSDYYSFQQTLIHKNIQSRVKNDRKPTQSPNSSNPQQFSKTYSIPKPSTSRTVQSRGSKAKLMGVIGRVEKSIGRGQAAMMSNTATGFSKPNQTQKNLISYAMNSTSCSFRPGTNCNQRKVNNSNLSEEHNNYLNKYQIIKQLGKGTYGVVHLATHKREPPKLGNYSTFQQVSLSAYGLLKQQQREENALRISTKKDTINYQHTNQPNLTSPADNKTCQNILDLAISQQTGPGKPQLADSDPILNIEKVEEGDEQKLLYAIKIYEKFKVNKDPTKFKNIRKQINIMQNINHPNIIRLYESVDTLTKINLVVEYGGKLSLLDYLKENYPLAQRTMRSIGKQLLSALVYLHDKNIVHRDLKLQNVLMMGEQVKIIDFGFSTLTYKNRKLNAICGTPNYMAPELLSKKEYIGEQADIWSYGVVMYTIAEGKHPFKADSYNQLDRLVNKGVYQFKRITDPVHQAFIKRILKVKPQERPHAKQLLGHPWLNMSQEVVDSPDQ